MSLDKPLVEEIEIIEDSSLNPKKKTNKLFKDRMSKYEVRCDIFDEDEEHSKIKKVTYLKKSILKRVFIVPIISLITGFLFFLILYWFP
jgi:hypothetical protein